MSDSKSEFSNSKCRYFKRKSASENSEYCVSHNEVNKRSLSNVKYFQQESSSDCAVDSVRLAELSSLSDQCSHDNLLYIKKTIKSLLKRDFIVQLPIEISLHILGYLSAQNLFICAQVSRGWRRICDDHLLWHNMCKTVNISYFNNNLLNSDYNYLYSPSNRNDVDECNCDELDKSYPNSDYFQVKYHRNDQNVYPNEIDWKQLYRHYMQIQCNWRNGGLLNPIVLPAHHVYKDWAITGSDDSSICVWDLNRNQCLINLFGHLGGVWSITIVNSWNPNEKGCVQSACKCPLLVSGSCDCTARVWLLDGSHWPCITTLFGHQSIVRCLAGQKPYLGSEFCAKLDSDTNIIHNMDSQLSELIGERQRINLGYLETDKYSPFSTNSHCTKNVLKDLSLVVTGSRDTTLRLWNVLNGECIHHFRGHRGAIRCVQFTGFQIASGSYDCTIRLWCAITGLCLHVLAEHTNRVYTLMFDGSTIISGSLDTTIRVWEASTGKLKQTFCGHRSLTTKMVLSNCANMLVSSNVDETVRVWHITTGKCLHTFSGPNKHQSAVTCVQLIYNFIISSGDDGTVKLWDKESGTYIRDLIRLDGAGRGGVIWRILASDNRLVCVAGSRNGMESTKIIVLHFNENIPDSDLQLSGHICRPKQKYAPVPRLSQLLSPRKTPVIE